MIDRRSFMTGSVAVAAGAVWHARGDAHSVVESTVIVLVDRRVEGGEQFAAAARARGLQVHEFDSDVAALWMRELEPRLRAGPTAITGRTSAATLFCLELLARDYGARCVQRVDGETSVTWVLDSSAPRRAALAPQSRRSVVHA